MTKGGEEDSKSEKIFKRFEQRAVQGGRGGDDGRGPYAGFL